MNARDYKIFDKELKNIHANYAKRGVARFKEYKNLYDDFFYHFQTLLSEHNPKIIAYDNSKLSNTGNLITKKDVGNVYNEYNMSLLFRLDDVEANIVKPGLVTLKFDVPKPKKYFIFSEWMNKNSQYINPTKFQTWCEQLFEDTSEELDYSLEGDEGTYDFVIKKSSTAFTICVTETYTKFRFDVNVGFGLDLKYWPYEDDNFEDKWLAQPTGSEHDQHHWKYSFPSKEISLLNCNIHMKNSLIFIRRLRHNQHLNFITSYHIDTLFLNALNTRTAIFWSKNVAIVFVEMLNALHTAFVKKELPSFWDQKYNLFDNLTDNQMKSGREKINSVLRRIDSYCDKNTPEDIIDLLLTNEEFETYEDN